MLQHSGKLLIRSGGRSYDGLGTDGERLDVSGYRLEPLFKAFQMTPAFSRVEPGEHWFLANPDSFNPLVNPWDLAHQVARASGYSFFAEPDLLLQAAKPLLSVPPTTGLNTHWPPHRPVSPAWHLLPGFTGFESVRATLG